MRHRGLGPRDFAGVLAALAVLVAGCGENQPPDNTTGAAARAEVKGVDTLSLAERERIPGWVAFVSEREGAPDVYGIQPTGEERPLTSSPAAEYPAAVAPDGSALLVVRTEEGGREPDAPGVHRESLLLHPLNGEQPMRLGPATARVRNPHWSPDGEWVVFESDSASFRDLYRIDRGGQDLRRLTDNPEGNFEPAVAPDGEHIAFVSSRDGNAEIYRMRADGTGEQRLTAFHRDDVSPRWSPDGRWIAFLSDREGRDRIFLMAPDGTGQRKLNAESGAPGPDWQEEDPAWSPDGSRIAYVAREQGGRATIWVTDVETGERTRIPGDQGNDEMPAWSPDGRYLAFVSDRDGDPELYLARADGSAPTRLTRSPGADWLPRWIPEPGPDPTEIMETR